MGRIEVNSILFLFIKKQEKREIILNDFKFLSKGMMNTLSGMGYKEFTPIQEKCIPKVYEGKDVLGQAQTGSGKTAAFLVPLIEKIDAKKRKPQVLILCPTRELAKQIGDVGIQLTKHLKGVFVTSVYGGQKVSIQKRILKKGCQIIVGTPGRTLDLIKHNAITVGNIQTVVLDEADEMLDMGFRKELTGILDILPKVNQTLLFSATINKEISKVADKFLNDPEIIKIDRDLAPAKSVKQFYILSKDKLKPKKIEKYIKDKSPNLTIVFCNTKRKVDFLHKELKQNGIDCGSIHGDVSQNVREQVMKKFKSGKVKVLIATDVAARGIDIKNIETIINYDLPQTEESYIHRIGRTGRAGKKGKAYSLVTLKQEKKLFDLSKKLDTKITLVENM